MNKIVKNRFFVIFGLLCASVSIGMSAMEKDKTKGKQNKTIKCIGGIPMTVNAKDYQELLRTQKTSDSEQQRQNLYLLFKDLVNSEATPRTVKLAIARGIDINAFVSNAETIALTVAGPLTHCLLQYGANPNTFYNKTCGINMTELHSAACMKDLEKTKLLLSYGADANITNTNGRLALKDAIATHNNREEPNFDIANLLFKYGAQPYDEGTKKI